MQTFFRNNKKRSKPVLQYDLNGIFIKEYINSKFASNETGIPSCLIQQCCNTGKTKNSKACGYQWRYKIEDSISYIKPYTCTLSIPIVCYNKEGCFVKEFSSMLEASKELNIPTGNISKHLSDNSSICYGYIFKYFKEDYPLKIKKGKRIHKNQLKVIITNLESGIITQYDSFRTVPNNIIARVTLSLRFKNNISTFTHKNRYKIEIEKY